MKITITHGSKEIHGARVLKDVNMTLESGAVYGFLGKNGSGKTMLMRAVCGLIGLTEGNIDVDGITIGKGQDFPSKLGMLLETPVFLPDRTGYGNLRLLAAIRGETAPEEIMAALEQTGLDPKDRRKVRKYSLGMRQRLGIACAIMESPGLLVLDEPFNGLDEDGCRLLRGIIGRQREAGCLILLACHDREELETLSDWIYRVEDGVFFTGLTPDAGSRVSGGLKILGVYSNMPSKSQGTESGIGSGKVLFHRKGVGNMMRKIMSIMLLTIALAGIGCRLYWLNARYPGPEEQTYGLGESVRLGSYTVTFSGWSWSDGEILHELCPGFRLLPDENGQEYPISRERIGLAALTIEKTGTDDGTLDLTSMAFESGAWGNQFDMELMYLLNPQLGTLRLQMEEGESMEILLPMTMTDQQFTREQWKRIDDRTFYVVLEHYPQKTRFSCGGGIG